MATAQSVPAPAGAQHQLSAPNGAGEDGGLQPLVTGAQTNLMQADVAQVCHSTFHGLRAAASADKRTLTARLRLHQPI